MENLLELDKQWLITLQGIIPERYSSLVVFGGETVVLWCAFLLVFLWLYGVYRHDNSYKIITLQIFALIASVFIIYSIVNLGVPEWRPHPSEVLNGTNIKPLIPHPTDNSFPSGHALFSGALLVGLWIFLRQKWVFWLTLIIALLTLSCRVLGGVHYPGDVIIWLIVGVLGAIVFHSLTTKCINKISPFILKVASFLKL